MSNITKYAILDAFNKLLKTKAFSKIKISDITKECGISRMTFYYHFDDVYDMIDWALEEKMRVAVDKNFTYATWRQGFTSVFEACLAEKAFFLKVFPSIDLRKIEMYLSDIARGFILHVIDEKIEDMQLKIREESKKTVCEIYGYAIVGVLLDWISKGMKETPSAVVNRFGAIMRGSLKLYLEQAAESEI